MARKHYLQITDDHHLAGCGITPESKAVTPPVTAASFIPIHVPSAKTQSLKNKAFPVIDRHGPSVGIPQVGDEGLELRAVSKWKITDVVMGNAESDAFPEVSGRKLQTLLQAWASLPESVKDALLVMVSDRTH